MFNEGYGALQGEALVREDLCAETIRLAEIVAAHPVTGAPQTHALAALMLFQGARFETRQDAAGEVLLLPDQDRDLWDKTWIERGLRHLGLAAAREQLTEFHLQAGIAGCHAVAPSYEATDRPTILGYYQALAELNPSPILTLNRAVALAMVDGPAASLSLIESIQDHPLLKRYYLLPATRGELHRRLGETAAARTHYARALEFAAASRCGGFFASASPPTAKPKHATRREASPGAQLIGPAQQGREQVSDEALGGIVGQPTLIVKLLLRCRDHDLRLVQRQHVDEHANLAQMIWARAVPALPAAAPMMPTGLPSSG